MHVYSKLGSRILAAVAIAASGNVQAELVTLNVPKAATGICSAYQLCHQRGVLSVGRSPVGIYGFLTPPDGKCVALLLDAKRFAQVRPKNGATMHVAGIALPRLPVADGIVSLSYFDRTLVEGSCGERGIVIYVTGIKRSP